MTNARYILFSLFISMALYVDARTFSKGEEIYINVQQSDAVGDWSKQGANIYLYLFVDDSKNEWIQATKEDGFIYKITFKTTCTYPKAIVVRGSAANWGSKWNQSPDINIPEDWNCIDDFNDASHRWKMYTPAVGKVSAYSSTMTAEKISVCAASAGDPFSLKAKLNSAKTDYDYSPIHGHGWYQSENGSSWISIDQYAGNVRDGEQNIDTLITLPKPIPSSGVYYYLHSSLPAGRRLIQVKPDADKCALDCEITSFETAISAVNADNHTYTLDGMVAFGEANGNLVISCDGKDTVITDPKSPQTFSLYGVPAATESGKTTTASAYFQGDQVYCSKTITIDIPNSTEAVQTMAVDSLTGKDFVLRPKNTEPTNPYVWLVRNDQTGATDTIHDAPQTLNVSGFSADTSLTYIYKEYYPSNGTMDDLMTNGNYEDATMDYGTYGDVSTISDYNFWGRFPETKTTQINFYKNATVNPSGLTSNGFAVVQDAHHFAPSYAKVEAKDGDNFALFDAATGAAGGNKKAWYATTANNPNLKLKKGTTYVLSFWAANINNYGEMDNAARFLFRIEYNGHVWNSAVLDLSKPEFRNNIWHQHSETFLADEDCDDVTISVVNLNTNVLHIGNDFALDDIQFHPISSVSKVVKSQQQFIVTAHEPKIDVLTVTPRPIDCGASTYTVDLHVVYQNPAGQLIIRDKTTNTDYPYAVTAGFDTPTALDRTVSLNAGAADTHEWEAYFESWPTAQRLATSDEPPFLPCAIYRDTICEGDNYTDNGFNLITPPVGDSMYVSAGKDTLYLTVADAKLMFTKWTDVIFINNKDGRFVSFQWYADDVAMNGETNQVLYDPKGLSGTTTLYHCCLTTRDGKTVMTCPMKFDDITPSRTQSSGSQASSVKIYDAMGRRIEGQLTKGIYIRVEEREGETITTKLFVYE